jgi:deoxyribose-phosphate aldolase
VTPNELAPYIDHTLLKPETTRVQVEKLCQEAQEYGFFAVCVNSRFVEVCKDLLKGSPVKIAAVVGFPLGAMDTKAKAYETKEAVAKGADEIDMVISIGAIKENNWSEVERDIAEVVKAASKATVKVIIETSLLNNEEKVKACEASVKAGAHFVKTSTGFNGGGATVEDIKLMKKAVGHRAKIKASGGVRDLATAKAVIEAGADRIGTSSGVLLITGKTSSGGY